MPNLKRLFRSTSSHVLKVYFSQRDAEFPEDFDWSLDEAKLAAAVEHALTNLPHETEDDLRAELEIIQEIASEDGWKAIDEVCGAAGVVVPEDGGAEGAAFFVAMKHPSLLPKIVNAASMNRYTGGRQWGCFKLKGAQLAKDTFSDPDAQSKFVDAVLEARKFPTTRPRYEDWFPAMRRDPVTGENTEITFLTLYLLDRPIKEMTVDRDKKFRMALRQRVDEIIFTINPADQEIEVYAKGGAKMHDALAHAFCDSFFSAAVEPVRVDPREVNFGPLKQKTDFDLSPEDRIDTVSVVKLKFYDNNLRSLYEHASDNSEVYDIIERKLGDRSPLNTRDLMIAATIRIKRAKGEGKTLTIDLGYPCRTTLPNQTEDDRKLSMGLLERWGILAREMDLLEAPE